MRVALQIVIRASLVLAGLALLAPWAIAQKANLPEEILKSKQNPQAIAGQLRLALDQSKRALAEFEAAGEVGPLDAPVQHATNAYVLMRSALAGMQYLKAVSKFPDPMLELAERKTHRAWALCRTPVDHVTYAHTRTEYYEISTKALTESIQIQQQVLGIWP